MQDNFDIDMNQFDFLLSWMSRLHRIFLYSYFFLGGLMRFLCRFACSESLAEAGRHWVVLVCDFQPESRGFHWEKLKFSSI